MQGKTKETLFWDKFGLNNVCKTCTKTCKQHGGVEIVRCPNFVSNGQQIEVNITKPKKTTKRKERIMKESNITAGTLAEHTKRIMSYPDMPEDKKTYAKGYQIVFNDGRPNLQIKKLSKYCQENDINYGNLYYTLKSDKWYNNMKLIKM